MSANNRSEAFWGMLRAVWPMRVNKLVRAISEQLDAKLDRVLARLDADPG